MKAESKTKAQLIQELADLSRRVNELEAGKNKYKKAAAALKESEERYRTAIEYSNDGFAIVQDGKHLFVNQKYLEIFGFDRAEAVLGNSVDEVVHPNDRQRVMEFSLGREKGEPVPQRYEYKGIRKDGHQINIEVSATRTAYQGKPVTLAYLRDITERKQAEKLLSQAEEKYRTSVENAIDGIFQITSQGKILTANIALAHILGYESTQELIDTVTDLGQQFYVDLEDRGEFIRLLVERGRVEGLETQTLRKDGRKIWVSMNVREVYDRAGGQYYYEGTVEDITLRKEAEASLLREKYFIDSAIESLPGIFYLFDEDRHFLKWNRNFEIVTGYSSEEISNMSPLDLFSGEEKIRVSERIWEVFLQGQTQVEAHLVSKKGGKTPYLLTGRRFISEGLIFLIGMGIDITERRKIEEALCESEDRYRDLVEHSRDLICTHDLSGRILSVNKEPLRILGYEKDHVLKMNLRDILIPEGESEFEEYLTVIKNKGAAKGTMAIQTAGGERRIWEYNNTLRTEGVAEPIVRGMAHDITEQNRARKEITKIIEKLRKAMSGIIQAMALTVETRDPYTAGHQRRVADLARSIAQEMGLPEDKVDGLRMAGIVHDLGKISIPTEILIKPTQLSDIEFKLIKIHPEISHDILKDIDFPWPVAKIVLQHHERINGSGYPLGLSEEDIYLEARILAVADVVEAIASHRPYRPAHGIDVALEEITKNKGKLYDPVAVEACLKLFKEKGFKFEEC